MRSQYEGVRAWWSALDEVDRRRALRAVDGDDPLLAQDLASGLAMHGVTVVPGPPSPVDGGPGGWFPPPVLDEFVADLRGEDPPPGPRGRACHVCSDPVEETEEYVEVYLPVGGLIALVHVDCWRRLNAP